MCTKCHEAYHQLTSASLHRGQIIAYTRGHSWKLKKVRFSTGQTAFFFGERIITWWNSLDEDTVSANRPTLNYFKRKLQKWKDEDGSTFGRDV